VSKDLRRGGRVLSADVCPQGVVGLAGDAL
jgi:hypothetical protein